jgi:hypothetical protein
LLIGCQHGDRVADVRARLVAHSLEVGWWRTHWLTWSSTITWRGPIGGASGVHPRFHRFAACIGATRNRRESDDLCVGEREVARVREQEIRGGTDWTSHATPGATGHRARTAATTTGARRWLCGGRRQCC